jgi:hypothetical protein
MHLTRPRLRQAPLRVAGQSLDEQIQRVIARDVLNPKMLAGFIGREPTRLGSEDIELISFHVSRYVRAEVNGRS